MSIIAEPESQVLSNKKTKKRIRLFYSDEIKAKAVELYNQGVPVVKIKNELKIKSVCVIYIWIRKALEKSDAPESKKKLHPAVSKVISAITKERKGGEVYSLASDFGISANAEKEETDNSVELKFCPCCGTNIKAVMIALQTCQEMR